MALRLLSVCGLVSLGFTAVAALAEPRVYLSLKAAPAGAAQDAIDRLAWARSIAKTKRRLPFRLSCVDYQDSEICRNGGRSALAALQLDRVRMILPIFDEKCLFGDERCQAEQTIVGYEIHFPYAAGEGLSWQVEVSPARGLKSVRLVRTAATFH